VKNRQIDMSDAAWRVWLLKCKSERIARERRAEYEEQRATEERVFLAGYVPGPFNPIRGL